MLHERSNHFRQKMAIPHLYTSPSGHSIPKCKLEDLNLTVLPQTRQLQVFSFSCTFIRVTSLSAQGIFTILRSNTCKLQDFIFFVDRLSTLLMEYALQYLPYGPKTVITPTEAAFTGKVMTAKVSPLFRSRTVHQLTYFSVYLRCFYPAIVRVSFLEFALE
jgi:uridine kinase